MVGGHRDFCRYDNPFGSQCLPHLAGELALHPENGHFHESPHKEMVQLLLVGQYLFLYLVQTLEQQVGNNEDHHIPRKQEIGYPGVYPPYKVQAEQDCGHQVPHHLKPEVIENPLSCVGAVFNLLYQLPRSQLLVFGVIHPADLLQGQQLEIQVDFIFQLYYGIHVHIVHSIGHTKNRTVEQNAKNG